MQSRGSESKSPHTPEKIHDLLGAEAKRIAKLRLAMADVALDNSGQHDQLIAAAESVVENAQGLLATTRELEVVEFEPFGGEESYWTVFRMFTRDENVGKVHSIEDIWDLLTKNYDMSEETLDTLQTTLVEWANDIAVDAQEKGIRGKFIAQRAGFVFAEMQRGGSDATEPSEDDSVDEEIGAEDDEARRSEEVERDSPRAKLLHYISDCIGKSEDRSVKQASIKKDILRTNPHLTAERLQAEIDSLVGTSDLFKFRRDKVSYLSLIERQDEMSSGQDEDSPEKKKRGNIDMPKLIKILEILCAPGRHYQQKLTINALWRELTGTSDKSQSPPAAEIDLLKAACRDLVSIGLIEAGGQKMGTGGVRTNGATSSKRHRSGSRMVYKVGLSSQESKVSVQKALAGGQIEDFLDAKLSQS